MNAITFKESLRVDLANPLRIGFDVMAAVLEPSPPIDYGAWAVDNVVFSKLESPTFHGPFNRALWPEFEEIFRALSPADPCRKVTLIKSAQCGGTVIANIFVLASVDLDPGVVLYTCPTEELARRHSRTKLAPMMRNAERIAKLFPTKSRDGADSVFYKERADGLGAIQLSGANSPATLSQLTVGRQVQDDLGKWTVNDGGDPQQQADSRSRGVEFAKILKIGTPLVDPGCTMTASFKAGSQEKPYVPCPHCDEFQVLEWGNMLATIEEDPDDPHFTCIACGCEIREHHLRPMKTRLEWRAGNEKAKRQHRSFWIWSAYSALQSWIRIAQEWLAAKGDPGKEQTFYNDTCGLAYETKGESPPWEDLVKRALASHYDRGRLPAGALVLTAGVDCQTDRVEVQLVAWGRDGRRWVIDYLVFQGHISEERCQDQLDALLKQTWPNAFGRRIAIDRLAIDGGAWTEDVWSWVKRHPTHKVIMVHGASSEAAPVIARVKKERNRKTGKVLRYSKRFYTIGVSYLKMRLYRLLRRDDPLQAGYVHFPRGLDDEFFRMLCAEKRIATLRKDGFQIWKWIKDKNQPNEGLDNHLYAEAAAFNFGVTNLDAWWDRYEAERESPLTEVQGDLEDLIGRPAPAPRAAPSPPKAPEPAGPKVVTAAGAPPNGDKPPPGSPGRRLARRLA